MPRARAPRSSIRKPINLSDYDLLHIVLTNDSGKEILNIDFDRIADKKPQLSIGIPGSGGDVRVGTTVFDVDA